MRIIDIYTDGGCNQLTDKKGTWAYVAIEGGNIIQQEYGNVENTTNSVMELLAMKNAYLYALSLGENTDIVIHSDSSYIVNGCNEWGDNWLVSDYKNGKIKYQDIWNEFLPLRKPNIEVRWIKGHNGDVWNNYVDDLTNIGRDVQVNKHDNIGSIIYDSLNHNFDRVSDEDCMRIGELLYREYIKRGLEVLPLGI